MKCADPVLCYNKKYRHYSLASPTFKLLHNQVFNCGKCIFCRKKKSRELAIRCVLHASLYIKNCFLTLTYDESHDSYHNNFDYTDIQKFKKKLRRHCDYHLKKKIQIFNVHEYGKNGKKHWHLVVFNHDFDDKQLFTVKNGNRLYQSADLSQLWPMGFCTIGDVTEASAMYQAQYMEKDLRNGFRNSKRQSHSKHSGIGRDYFLLHYRQILSLAYIPHAGIQIPIPRYFYKLAEKHWAHFFEPTLFFDNKERKAKFRPFKTGLENRDIAEHFIKYKEQRKIKIEEMIETWDDFIKENAFSKDIPDFRQAAENYLHDLNTKNKKEEF